MMMITDIKKRSAGLQEGGGVCNSCRIKMKTLQWNFRSRTQPATLVDLYNVIHLNPHFYVENMYIFLNQYK